jgi:hypothetical protein
MPLQVLCVESSSSVVRSPTFVRPLVISACVLLLSLHTLGTQLPDFAIALKHQRGMVNQLHETTLSSGPYTLLFSSLDSWSKG